MTTAAHAAPPARSVTYPKGFRVASGAFGIKPSGKPDLMLLACAPGLGCVGAAVFTTSRCPGAPVTVGKRHARNGDLRAIVCNAGISNVMTGQQGLDDAATMCTTLARHLGCSPKQVLPASTGVIGPRLPMPKVTAGIDALAPQLGQKAAAGVDADHAAAHAILTTDLVPKPATASFRHAGTTYRLGGFAKGSGMIQPNLATMLAFLTTDAAVAPDALRYALRQATATTFNRISVDHDTSTSDAVAILANGAAGGDRLDATHPAYPDFIHALTRLCHDLAQQVVRDGEGATKLYHVRVENAWSIKDADKVGHAVTGSPLVKCAVHGNDPNWGRLVMAVGRSSAKVDPARLSIHIGRVCLCKHGEPRRLTAKQQAALDAAMQGRDVRIRLDLGFADRGTPPADWTGCDLSADYIRINAEYTT